MKKLLLAIIIVFAFSASTAYAGQPAMTACGNVDTTSNNPTPMQTLGGCTFTTGPYGLVFIVDTAEVVCGGTETVQQFVGNGSQPYRGSNFQGTVASGILSVPVLVAGIQSPFLITPGSFLTNFSGTNFTPTPIISQLTGPEITFASFNASIAGATLTVSGAVSGVINIGQAISGTGIAPGTTVTFTNGVSSWLINPAQTISPAEAMITTGWIGGTGTYSISDVTLSVPTTTTFSSLNPVPADVTYITPAWSQTACNNGFVVTTIEGVFTGTPNTTYWTGTAISTDTVSGRATFNNSKGIIFVY